MSYRDKVSGIGIIIRNKERLPLGNGSRGKLTPAEKGRRSIFVPSFGAMEKEEIEYVTSVAQEQEDERLKNKEKSGQKRALEYVTGEVRKADKGKRAEKAKELTGGE